MQEWPLAVSDGRTVPVSRLVECQRIRPTSRGNTVYVLFGEETMWYYMSAQDNEDVVLFKSYDSDIQKTCCEYNNPTHTRTVQLLTLS